MASNEGLPANFRDCLVNLRATTITARKKGLTAAQRLLESSEALKWLDEQTKRGSEGAPWESARPPAPRSGAAVTWPTFASSVTKYVEAELDQRKSGKVALGTGTSALFLSLVRESEKPQRVSGAPRRPAPPLAADAPRRAQRWATRCGLGRRSCSRTW
jgi:hypothetical protein